MEDEKPSVVAVDSEKEILKLYRSLGAIAGIDCHTTDSHDDAIQKLSDAKLVIVNSENMPFVSAARDAGYKGGFVLATGGDVQYSDYKALKVDEVLKKPFGASELQGIMMKYTSQQKRILVVEDDGTNRLSMATKIRQMGYTAMTVINAEEGVEKFVSANAVFTDIVQPDSQGGLWLLAKIRERYDSKQMPVVIMSSRNISIEDIRGANIFVSKPVEPNFLERIVNTITRNI